MIINNFDDILRAMEQDPALREAMRRHILTEELLQLPAQVNRLENSVNRLQEGQDRLETRMDNLETRMGNLEAGQEELKSRMDRMAGRLGAIFGSDYETRSLRVAPRKLRQVMGIRNATLILAARQIPLNDIFPILEQAITSGRISEAEADDLEALDLAFAGEDPSGNTIQAAIEASVTVDQEDTRRSVRRAGILERATGTPTKPAIIGDTISPEDRTHADTLGVTFIQVLAPEE